MEQLSRKEFEIEQRRFFIINQAESLFAERGYEGTTMSEIADASELALATVYHCFQSKEDIFLTLVEKKIEEFLAFVQEDANLGQDTSEKISRVIHAQAGYFERNKKFFKILIFMNQFKIFSWINEQGTKGRIGRRFMDYLIFLADIISEGKKEGTFGDFDPMDMSFSLIGMLQFLIYRWIIEDENRPISVVAKSAITVFLSGLQRTIKKEPLNK
jgi:AcrR family transcriptional regulator